MKLKSVLSASAALSLLLCGALLSRSPGYSQANRQSSSSSRYVVAHWIVPMPYASGQSAMERAKDDVRAAVEEGLDGFAMDAFSGSQAHFLLASYIAAANSIGADQFKFFVSVDTGLGFKFKPEEIVKTMLDYGDNPHYLKINGKPLLSTFGGDKLPSGMWQTKVTGALRSAGHPVTFVPYFDRPNPNGDMPNYAKWNATVKSFPDVDGLFNFLLPASTPFYSGSPNLGHHWWSTLEGEENLAKALHDQGKLFIAPYMPYYWAVCHPVRQYLEYQGGRGMGNAWTSIITKQKPEMVEVVTWNDFSESTFIQPTSIPITKFKGIETYPHLGYYELLKYYIAWYHRGAPPTVIKDALFYFYRPNLRQAEPRSEDTLCSLGPVKSGQIWGKVEDVVYLTTVLTADAEVRVSSGGKTVTYPAQTGINTIESPLSAGPQKFELWRNGKRIAGHAGVDVQSNLPGDNFNVYGGYSTSAAVHDDNWHPSDPNARKNSSNWFE